MALAALRALAWLIVLALLLDAPAGPRRAVPPIAALDASASWLRGGDSALWRARDRHARGAHVGAAPLRRLGAHAVDAPRMPRDAATRALPARRARARGGTPLVLVTDGELDDPGALRVAPAGSRVVRSGARAARDRCGGDRARRAARRRRGRHARGARHRARGRAARCADATLSLVGREPTCRDDADRLARRRRSSAR